MKLVEDDGSVSEEIPNDAAVLIIHADRVIRVITPPLRSYKEGRIPFHVRMVRALASFLRFESNAKLVMRHAPTSRNPQHRHH